MSDGPPKTILIVDDEYSVREVLTTFFQQAYGPRGYTVETANDGPAALAAVRRQRPALVLLDIEMPGMNGVEALRSIRAIDSRIPVIMVTGTESTRLAGAAITGGASYHLPNPRPHPVPRTHRLHRPPRVGRSSSGLTCRALTGDEGHGRAAA